MDKKANMTENSKWDKVTRLLNTADRTLSGLILSDFHFPDHDSTAIALAIKCLEQHPVDYIVLNGDIADFTNLSKFEEGRQRDINDVLSVFEDYYTTLINSLSRHTDYILYVSGNHDRRMDRFLAEHWQVRDTVEAAFRDVIRQNGRVIDSPRYVSDVIIGSLLIQHGNRANMHAAKTAIEDIGHGVSVVSGHAHRPSYWLQRVIMGSERFSIKESVVSGCLCNLVPSYEERHKSIARKWAHGVVFAYHDSVNNDAHVYPVHFHPYHNRGSKGIAAVIKGNLIRQEAIDGDMWV